MTRLKRWLRAYRLLRHADPIGPRLLALHVAFHMTRPGKCGDDL